MKTEFIKPENVRHGDTLLINGVDYTISRNDIKKCPFMGVTIRGQRFKQCERVLYPKWYKGEIIDYRPQV